MILSPWSKITPRLRISRKMFMIFAAGSTPEFERSKYKFGCFLEQRIRYSHATLESKQRIPKQYFSIKYNSNEFLSVDSNSSNTGKRNPITLATNTMHETLPSDRFSPYLSHDVCLKPTVIIVKIIFFIDAMKLGIVISDFSCII